MVRCKQHFLIVAAWIVRRLNDQEPVHPGIQASAQISPCHVMTVIPPRAGGLRRERVTLRAAALNHRRSFLHRAIGLRGHVKPMPVYDVVDIRVVADIDADLAAFARRSTGPGTMPL